MMSIRNWIRKHKTSIIVSASAAGIGYLCYRTIKAHYVSIQEREAHVSLLQQAELRAESQLQLHFQSIQRISDTSRLPNVLPQLKSELSGRLDLSGLTGKLMQGKDAPQILSGKEKLELWETLKILCFTRAFSSMCSLTMMVLLVRVQLNVLARHVYIDTARDISAAEPVDQRRSLSRVFQQNYLAFAEFLPREGLEMLISDVKAAAEEVLASKTLREPCTLKDLREIFESIAKNLNINKTTWLPYMLPKDVMHSCYYSSKSMTQYGSEGEEVFDNDEKLRSLLEETRAILDSEEFADVLASSLDGVLDKVIEDFSIIYQDRKTASMHLAKLIPPVASLGDSFLEQPDENRFVQLLIKLPQLQTFCATVYSAGQHQVG